MPDLGGITFSIIDALITTRQRESSLPVVLAAMFCLLLPDAEVMTSIRHPRGSTQPLHPFGETVPVGSQALRWELAKKAERLPRGFNWAPLYSLALTCACSHLRGWRGQGGWRRRVTILMPDDSLGRLIAEY